MKMFLAALVLLAFCTDSTWGQAGCAWSPVGPPPPPGGVSQWVKALATYDDGGGTSLYAAGLFSVLGGIFSNYVAEWDGTAWSTLGAGLSNAARALVVHDDGTGPALYAGGDFTHANGWAVPSVGIARWDGFTWSPVGLGLNGSVRALAVFDDGAGPALYAGGFFLTSGLTTVGYVAKWDGVAWTPLASGLNDAVYSLGVFDDGSGPALYAGGVFTGATAGVACSRVARWDGSVWSAVGDGMNDGVWVLGVHDDGSGPALYAGGDFNATGLGSPLKYLGRWDGSSWSPVGPPVASGGGLTASVRTLCTYDDDLGRTLYAGGYFQSVTGVGSTPHIARWDGVTWAPVGSGMNGKVRSMAVYDEGGGPALYAGGSFSMTNSLIPTYKIGRWDCGTGISLTLTQPGGPGFPVYFHNTNLTPGREYLSLFSLDLCPGGPGTGFYAGLCIFTQPNLQFMLDQLQLPLGTPLFHFTAPANATWWGPWAIGPLVLDGLCFDFTGGVVGDISPAVRLTIQ